MIESAFLNYGTDTPMSINMPMALIFAGPPAHLKQFIIDLKAQIAIYRQPATFLLFNSIFGFIN